MSFLKINKSNKTVLCVSEVNSFSSPLETEEIIELEQTMFEIMVLMNSKYTNLRDWKYVDGNFVNENYSELEAKKLEKKIQIKEKYLNDISWTDDVFLWYEKKKFHNLETSEDTIGYEEAMLYWKEANESYSNLKSSIQNSVSEEELNTLYYSPTFTNQKEESDVSFERRLKRNFKKSSSE